MPDKLILDQPDLITNEGKVEHVVEKPNKKINEEQTENEPVLLNESPSGYVEIKN